MQPHRHQTIERKKRKKEKRKKRKKQCIQNIRRFIHTQQYNFKITILSNIEKFKNPSDGSNSTRKPKDSL